MDDFSVFILSDSRLLCVNEFFFFHDDFECKRESARGRVLLFIVQLYIAGFNSRIVQLYTRELTHY